MAETDNFGRKKSEEKYNILKITRKETWPLKKMYVFCTDPSCHKWFPDYLLVKQYSFITAYPMNCQNKPVLPAWICT